MVQVPREGDGLTKMTWHIYLLANIIATVLRGFIEKKLVATIAPLVLVLYVSFWVLVFLVSFQVLTIGGLGVVYPDMVGVGVIFALALASYFSAIKISLSQTSVLAAFHVMVAMILSALFLGEWQLFHPYSVSGIKSLSGIGLSISAMWFLLVGHARGKIPTDAAWGRAILSYILLNGIGAFLSKAFLTTHDVLPMLVWQSAGTVVALLVLNVWKKNWLRLSLPLIGATFVNGLTFVLGTWLFFSALQLGPLSIVMPIQILSITILVALVGLVAFREFAAFTKTKLIGTILGIAGIVLLVV